MTTILRRAVLPLAVVLTIVLSATAPGSALSPALPESTSISPQSGVQPTLWVNIVGASALRPGGYCEWHGQAGTSVTRWTWSVNGVVKQSGFEPTFHYGGVSQSFNLRLDVVASNGATGIDSRGVTVTTSAKLCCDLSPGPACPIVFAPVTDSDGPRAGHRVRN
jgi:hypothetical protein